MYQRSAVWRLRGAEAAAASSANSTSLGSPLGNLPDDLLSLVVQLHRAGVEPCIQETVLCADCAAYCAAGIFNRHFSRRIVRLFNSPRGYWVTWQCVAGKRIRQQNSSVLPGYFCFLRVRAPRCGCLLCHFCATFYIDCAGFCAAHLGGGNCHRVGVVVIGNLQVVLICDGGRIADPTANDVQGKTGSQFRLPAGPQVVKQFRPAIHTRPFDNP